MNLPILPGAPWLIVHRSMLGINQPNKINLNGKNYVIWQNKKGEISALNDICPHMQAPLSDGWLCEKRNTIACPFHALEFDGNGKLYREGKEDNKPIRSGTLAPCEGAETLKLIIKDDCIWTYGEFEPRLPVPDLISKIGDRYELIGVTGEKSIQGNFLNNILINYDFNHLKGTHKEMFRIESSRVTFFEERGYYSQARSELIRSKNTLEEIIKNPSLLVIPKKMNNTLKYTFPSTTVIFAESPILSIAQTHILYPETEHITKTFVLLYCQFKYPVLKSIFKKSLLQGIDRLVQQDKNTVETLYPRTKAKIRLPGEEAMFYAEKLYRDWENN